MSMELGDQSLVMPLPRAEMEPLKVNLFERMPSVNTALAPLFPYLGDGCIVPTGTIFRGGPGRRFGTFEHFNTVDEVAIVFAAAGAQARPGMVFVGARTHHVGSFLVDEEDPASFVLVTVTQRQAEAGVPQSEGWTFRCPGCQAPLVEHRFDAKSPSDTGLGPLETILQSQAGADLANDKAARPVCPRCGADNPGFPASAWGWDRYAENCAATDEARAGLAAAMARGEEAR